MTGLSDNQMKGRLRGAGFSAYPVIRSSGYLLNHRKLITLALLLLFVLITPQGTARAAPSPCASPAGPEGTIIYNNSENVLQYCAAPVWVAFPKKDLTIPTAGLVSHWDFDEGSGTSAADSVGGQTGTLQNGLAWATGKVGNAIQFNDVNDGFSITPTAASGLGTVSFSFWTKLDTYPTTYAARILEHYLEWRIMVSQTTGEMEFWAERWDGGSFGVWRTSSIPLGQWVHIAITYDPSSTNNDPTIYFNGVPQALTETSSPSGTHSRTSSAWDLGNRNTYDRALDGMIDEFRVYNRELSATEVYALYMEGSDDPCDPDNAPAVGQVCADGSVYAGLSPDGNVPMYAARCDGGQTWDGSSCAGTRATFYWNNGNFNNKVETFLSSTTDGNGNTAGLIGIDSDSGTAGTQPHQAAQYCADLVQNDHSDWYLPAADELHVLATNAGAIGNLDESGGWPTGWYWSSTEHSGVSGIEAHDENIGTLFQNSGRNKDTLEPVRCVRQGYVPSCLNPYGAKGAIRYNANHKVLEWCDGTNWQAAGAAQDVSNGLVAYWNFEDGSGTNVADSVGNYDGSFVGGDPSTAWVPGKIGGALEFDGSWYVNAGDVTELNSATAFTISAWLRDDDMAVDKRPFGKYIDGNNDINGALWGSNGHLYFELGNGGNSYGHWSSYSADIAEGAWFHVALVFDGGGLTNPDRMKIYVNGVDQAISISGTVPTVTANFSGVDFLIGSDRGDNMIGAIDDLRIYDRALTGKEIQLLSGSGCSNPTGPEGSVIYNTTYSTVQYCDGQYWRGVKNGIAMPPCGFSPTIGDVCSDGTIYAGLSPDGNVPMYASRCDAGQTWDGSNCTGSRSLLPWNNGNSAGYTELTTTDPNTGESNTATIITLDSDSGASGTQPHQAAQYCADLTVNGRGDWYLPALSEVFVLESNKAAIGNFDTSGPYYWSSTEQGGASGTQANTVSFSTGAQGSTDKASTARPMRCVRK